MNSNAETETELLNTIKNDRDKFSVVFKLYYKQVFGYILRRTGNFDDAADIAATSFYKAFLHIDHFSYKGISIKVWLYRIATNEINQYFRNHQKHNSIFIKSGLENNQLENFYEDRKEMETELQKHEQFLYILNNVKTLPVKYQEVIALKYFEGKDNREIAEILNMNEGTLKSLLSRGLEKLRKKCNQI